jgi:hypothetical protein
VIRYLVTGLGVASVFIGFDWLKKHNPEIDWNKPSIMFTRCPEECNMTPIKGRPRNWQEAEDEEMILLIDFESALQARGVHIGAKHTTA